MTSPQNLVKNVICPDALLGRKALVGGASKGLGQAIAQALASSGAVVHGLSRDEATLSAAMQDLPGRVTEPLPSTLTTARSWATWWVMRVTTS